MSRANKPCSISLEIKQEVAVTRLLSLATKCPLVTLALALLGALLVLAYEFLTSDRPDPDLSAAALGAMG
jgi:hypothetical protein